VSEEETMSEEPPALVAARNSWRCAQANDKQGWLDLMTEDVCIEDPIGVGPTNPTGKGMRGKAEVSAFYDKHMGPSTISAHVLSITTTLPNGVKSRVRGIFTYRVNGEGKLTSLRGYWHLGVMEFEQPT
jgi:steroid delta-isomerase